MPDISRYITLPAYAAMHGRSASVVLRKIQHGAIKSAVRFGHQWLIDRDEPYPPDRRIKSGKYRGWSKRYGQKKDRR